MKYYTADKEAGNKIEMFNSIEEAEKAIISYEEEDRREGTYTPNFYDIIDENSVSVI